MLATWAATEPSETPVPPLTAHTTLLSTAKNQIRALRSALWLRPALMSVSAFAAALISVWVGAAFPDLVQGMIVQVDDGAVRELLRVMAGSMMTVATVTLSVLILVLSLAAGQASPRAVPELMADPATQNALGTFLSSFVFAITALLAFGFSGTTGASRSIVMVIAVILVANAIRYLVQWIHHVANTLKITQVINRVHRQGEIVLDSYLSNPDDVNTAPVPIPEPAPEHSRRLIHASGAGYVQLVDTTTLESLVRDRDIAVRLVVHEGDFVHHAKPTMYVIGEKDISPELAVELAATLVVGSERSSEGDPLLAIELLAEIACRALSQSINDSKTALMCIGYLEALLARAAVVPPGRYPAPVVADGRITLDPPDFAAMIERAFRPVARDGADKAEVLMAVIGAHDALARICQPAYRPVIGAEYLRVVQYGLAKLSLEIDRQALQEAASGVDALVSDSPSSRPVSAAAQ